MNNNPKIETSLFRNQQKISIFYICAFLAMMIGAMVSDAMDLKIEGERTSEGDLPDTEVAGIFLGFNLILIITTFFIYFVLFVNNLIKYIKYRLLPSWAFIKHFGWIILASFTIILLVKSLNDDGVYNLILTPQDTGIYLYDILLILINIGIYNSSNYNVEKQLLFLNISPQKLLAKCDTLIEAIKQKIFKII
jgi:hypothetical protein